MFQTALFTIEMTPDYKGWRVIAWLTGYIKCRGTFRECVEYVKYAEEHDFLELAD